VKRVIDGEILNHAILDVNVATDSERGMLGIVIASRNESSNRPFPFSSFTNDNLIGLPEISHLILMV
jgi:hypothetical protein